MKADGVRIGYKLKAETGSVTAPIGYGGESCPNTMISKAVGAFQKTDDSKEGVERESQFETARDCAFLSFYGRKV